MPRRFALLCLLSSLGVAGCAGTGGDYRSGFGVPGMMGRRSGDTAAERIVRSNEALEAATEVEVLRPAVSDSLASTTLLQAVPAGFRGRASASAARATRARATRAIVTGSKMDEGLVESLVHFSEPITLENSADVESEVAAEPVMMADASVISVNLPTALAMVGPQHPAVGFAQWRVQQAYAQLQQAQSLWLPTLRAGVGFHRHDGNYQASNGEIVDVNRNSLQYGLGLGATGAGTTPRPGVIAEFHLADAIFQPKIAGRTAAARSFQSRAVQNQQLMTAAAAYLELLGAHQDVRVMEEVRVHAADLSKLTSDFAATGAGLQADADRMLTELALVDHRLLSARERVGVAAARFAEAVSADADCQWVPMDLTVLPLEIVTLHADRVSLIQTGLTNRPELRESQSLVAAACERYRREKFAPFVPSVLLGFSNGGFGGGLGSTVNNVDSRYDFDALLAWEVRNFGLGEHAARRETSAQVQQAKFDKIRVMDQVAREVSEAYSQVEFRSQQVSIAEQAIQNARDSYQRNLGRIRDGQGIPLESLQSLRALEDAQRTYIRSVVEYNQAQFRLQWALGWPVTAPTAAPVAVEDSSI